MVLYFLDDHVDSNTGNRDLVPRCITPRLSKREWAHVISVLHLDNMTGNHQSKEIFEKLTGTMREGIKMKSFAGAGQYLEEINKQNRI